MSESAESESFDSETFPELVFGNVTDCLRGVRTQFGSHRYRSLGLDGIGAHPAEIQIPSRSVPISDAIVLQAYCAMGQHCRARFV
jgi:hypothetical protein